MVASVQGPTPFSVQLKAREFKLSGSNQVVFLIEGCRKVRGPDGGPVIREGMGKLPNKAVNVLVWSAAPAWSMDQD